MEEEKEVYFMEEQENVAKEADEGKLLVLRRPLSGLKGTKKNKGRTSFTRDAQSKGKRAP